jgi:hypothetical protein
MSRNCENIRLTLQVWKWQGNAFMPNRLSKTISRDNWSCHSILCLRNEQGNCHSKRKDDNITLLKYSVSYLSSTEDIGTITHPNIDVSRQENIHFRISNSDQREYRICLAGYRLPAYFTRTGILHILNCCSQLKNQNLFTKLHFTYLVFFWFSSCYFMNSNTGYKKTYQYHYGTLTCFYSCTIYRSVHKKPHV